MNPLPLHLKNRQQSMFDANLQCEEEHWDCNEEIIGRNYYLQEELGNFLEENLLRDDEELRSLLAKEQENKLIEPNPCWAKGRDDAVEWVLNFTGFYSFSALTSILAVNYLDRFLRSFHESTRGREKPWMPQLAAVACLSLAAKVEETRVPLLLDFQVEEGEFVFESKTIQRMEILVLSTLQWRMNPVTPHSFLFYFARRLISEIHLAKDFLRRCECLLLSIISDCKFLCYLPSTVASATMLYVISNVKPRIGVQFDQEQLASIFNLGIKKENVEDCCRLIQDIATNAADQFHKSNKRMFGSTVPSSPKGVVDISFSSADDNSWAVAFIQENQVSGSKH